MLPTAGSNAPKSWLTWMFSGGVDWLVKEVVAVLEELDVELVDVVVDGEVVADDVEVDELTEDVVAVRAT